MTQQQKRAFLLSLYRKMVTIRLCEESLVPPILNKDILCPVHLCSGQEAVAAGLCATLETTDAIFGTHRSHGHYLAKGGSLQELIAEVYCRETGCAKGRGGSMHLVAPEKGVLGVAPIVAGTVSLATGAALAFSIKGNNSVAVSFFGDGAMGEGVVAESMNFAALRNLPVIFACENNLYSTHLSIRECRPPVDIVETGRAYGIKGYKVDGNDVLAVFEKAVEAVKECRSGKGPILMELLTYRQRGHVGPDDNIQGTHTDIRPPAEIKEWISRDPITLFESSLVLEHGIVQKDLDEISSEVSKEVKQAHVSALAANFPPPSGLMKYVYAE